MSMKRKPVLIFSFLAAAIFAISSDAIALQTKAGAYSATTVAMVAPSLADQDNASEEQDANKDPYEKFNRSMFNFNDGLDKGILKPFAKFYNLIMPRPLNEGIHNFFVNLDTVPTIINDILQFNFHQMANDMWRFGINSTIGIGGLFDIATRIKLNSYRTDFGVTLAKWGYANSTYVVLPFWGPRTIRDTVSMPVDYFYFSLYPYIKPQSLEYGVYALSVVDWRAQALKHEDIMEAAAVDKYAFVRNAYMQFRKEEIENAKHRSYEDIKHYETPIAVVDASEVEASTDEPTLDLP